MLKDFCPLFDHDHAFAPYEKVISQTTAEQVFCVKSKTMQDMADSPVGIWYDF